MTTYTLVLSGPIGAGKTTILHMLADHLKSNKVCFAIVPEYLEGMKSGRHMLEAWTSGKITASEFNHYVMDSCAILNKQAKDYPIRILERAPFENASIFGKGEPALLLQATNIHYRYNIPLITDETCPISILNANLDADQVFENVLDIVKQDLEQNVPGRIIYLRVSVETSKQRVVERGRKAEKSYTEDYLRSIVQKYEQLFFGNKECQ